MKINHIFLILLIVFFGCENPSSSSSDSEPEIERDQNKFIATDQFHTDLFGCSVSLSADGLTALIGANGSDNEKGSAYIFTYNTDQSTWVQKAKLTASDRTSQDSFGNSVSLSSNGLIALIGASGDDENGEESGAAYIFEATSWDAYDETTHETVKLSPSVSEPLGYFGCSVCISGDGQTALIGSVNGDNDDGTSSGTAFIFESSSWSTYNESNHETVKVSASDGTLNCFFGHSVSISADGSVALIGALYDNSDIGSAYIFESSSWSTYNESSHETAKLTSSDGISSDRFGHSVTLSSDGSIALIGAYNDNNGLGSAYIFESPSWSTYNILNHEITKITPSNGEEGDFFGYSVSLSSDGRKALIGAPFKVDDLITYGSTYVFEAASWSFYEESSHEKIKLSPIENWRQHKFGSSVSMSSDGTYAIIGAELNSSVFYYSL